MDDPDVKKLIAALSAHCPRGWRVVGVMPEKREIDYVNSKGKHRLLGWVEIEGGVRVVGGRRVEDVMFE